MKAASNKLAAHWQPHIEAWDGSGKSQAAYCREHDLVKSRFNYWRHKLRPVQLRPLSQPGEVDPQRRELVIRLRVCLRVDTFVALRAWTLGGGREYPVPINLLLRCLSR